MKLTFLGTAAAEAQPAHFCVCETCKRARKNGGKDIRKRCCYRLDDDTLIDYGPDIYTQTLMYGIDLAQIKRIIFTHAHEDHLDPVELVWRNPGFSKVDSDLAIYGDKAVHAKIRQFVNYERARLIEHQIGPDQAMQAEDIELYALRAKHDEKSDPLNYFITRGGKTILIANDTGYWDDENWVLAKKYGRKLDLAVIESCGALLPGKWYGSHMTGEETILFREKLLELGLIDEKTRCITNHFSHNAMPIQEDMEKYFLPHGIEVAYDGLSVEV